MLSSIQQDSNIVCTICRRQISRYTCPECNLMYCSSTCFKSPAHTNCSEGFYKKQIEEDVRSQPSKSAEERLRMIEILKRFEEDDIGQIDSEDEEEEDFERRFAGIDASTSPNTLWSLLTESERDKFSKAIQDPSGNFAQELQNQLIREPWWEAEFGSVAESLELIDIPPTMVRPLPNGPLLIYNLCAICIAYAFITRRLGISPLSSSDSEDSQEAKRLLTQLVPFLADHKSTVLHTSLSAAILDVWSRFDKSTISSSAFTVLMHDAAILLRPLPVGVISSTSSPTIDISSHPNRTAVRVLSDLHRLFNVPAHVSHVAHKLIFYAAHVLSTPPLVLRSLADDIESRALDEEALDSSAMLSVKRIVEPVKTGGQASGILSPLIEEI